MNQLLSTPGTVRQEKNIHQLILKMSRSQGLCEQGHVIYLSGLPTKIVGEDEADKAKLLCTLCCRFARNSVGANQHIVHTTPVHLLVICTSCHAT